MSSENGRGTLTIRDVKEGDQGAYTCEAINAKGLVFAIPDGVLTLSRVPSTPTAHSFTATDLQIYIQAQMSGVTVGALQCIPITRHSCLIQNQKT